MIRVLPACPVSRRDLAVALDAARVGNRMLFGGNLVRQPVFAQARKTGVPLVRIVGDLAGADAIMNDCLFVGVYPGLTPAMCGHIASAVAAAVGRRLDP